MLTIHTSNVQLVLVLDGFHYPTSAWPDTAWTRTVDRNLNIDKNSRSGAYTLETQVCYNYAPEASVSYLTTKGQRVLPTTLGRYNGSTNGCRRASGALQTGLRAAVAR
jgi:hypothetical protein